MAARSSTDATIDRIIAAATAEFARYGFAGALVERIAKAARTSKERVCVRTSAARRRSTGSSSAENSRPWPKPSSWTPPTFRATPATCTTTPPTILNATG